MTQNRRSAWGCSSAGRAPALQFSGLMRCAHLPKRRIVVSEDQLVRCSCMRLTDRRTPPTPARRGERPAAAWRPAGVGTGHVRRKRLRALSLDTVTAARRDGGIRSRACDPTSRPSSWPTSPQRPWRRSSAWRGMASSGSAARRIWPTRSFAGPACRSHDSSTQHPLVQAVTWAGELGRGLCEPLRGVVGAHDGRRRLLRRAVCRGDRGGPGGLC